MWLQTVRVARDFGGIDTLLPDGIADWRDCPYVLFDAIGMALTFLSFLELPEEEQPHRSIWFDADALKEHWVGVEEMRKAKYGGDEGGSPSRVIDDPVQNDLTKRR